MSLDFPVTYARRVRFSDTDAQGIVFNANYPVYWDDAATDYFDAIGIPWDDLVEAGFEMVTAHLEIDFRAPARLADVVVTGVRVAEVGTSSLRFELATWRESDEALLAEGHLQYVTLTTDTFVPTAVPDFFLDAVERLQGAPVPRVQRGPRPLEAPPRPPVRYLEDWEEGEVIETSEYLVTREELLSFARQYDPQAIHIDEEAAANGPFGGLITSGWHTGAVVMRGFVEHVISPEHALGSPGIDELRWRAPVRPGDRIRARVTVAKVEVSERNPHRGTVHTHTEAFNQDDVLVMTMKGRGLYLRRPE
ncbi:MAG: MaoC family dehydratase N-terminal domain-containing protein [Acidimicrobiia bacterium]|nr:MAG: MaoC family dehydratase N-terminal domain-containing protein [Acidimicrobiia bacterium]